MTGSRLNNKETNARLGQLSSTPRVTKSYLLALGTTQISSFFAKYWTQFLSHQTGNHPVTCFVFRTCLHGKTDLETPAECIILHRIYINAWSLICCYTRLRNVVLVLVLSLLLLLLVCLLLSSHWTVLSTQRHQQYTQQILCPREIPYSYSYKFCCYRLKQRKTVIIAIVVNQGWRIKG